MNEITNGHHHHSHKAPLIIGGLVFALIAIAQAVRLYHQIPVTIGTSEVPLWVSGVAVAVSAILSLWQLGSACCSKCCSKGTCCKK